MESLDTPRPIVGFMTPPGWYDPSPTEFYQLFAGGIRVQQTLLELPDFVYSLQAIAATEPQQLAAARLLAAAGCEITAAVGSPFAWAGLDSVEQARQRCDRLRQASGAVSLMAGIAIIDALQQLGAARVGLACTYYSNSWKSEWAAFMHRSGFTVCAHNFADDGFMPRDAATSAEYWSPDGELILNSVRNLCRRNPDLDAVVVSGAGARTLRLADTIKRDFGVAAVGADTALYWAIAREFGFGFAAGGLVSAQR